MAQPWKDPSFLVLISTRLIPRFSISQLLVEGTCPVQRFGCGNGAGKQMLPAGRIKRAPGCPSQASVCQRHGLRAVSNPHTDTFSRPPVSVCQPCTRRAGSIFAVDGSEVVGECRGSWRGWSWRFLTVAEPFLAESGDQLWSDGFAFGDEAREVFDFGVVFVGRRVV